MKRTSAKTRSPSADRICSAAVTHFAEHGYDASSLNDIAEQVGIRKASLYTHFSGKNELYMEVFDDALRIELEFIERCFSTESDSAFPGIRYCTGLATRYMESEHLRFLLRTAYLPPPALREAISTGYQVYLDKLLVLFTTRLQKETNGQALLSRDVTLFGHAYLGIVDSLHVEVIYAGGKQSLTDRLRAFERLMTDSLACAPRQTMEHG